MAETTNSDRAGWAKEAVLKFGRITNMHNAGEELSTMIEDLVGNLMHLCDQNGLQFEAVLGNARHVYEQELQEGRLTSVSSESAITQPVPVDEQAAFQMFGVDVESIIPAAAFDIAKQGLAVVLCSGLSDAQECIDLGRLRSARQGINRAKYLIDKLLWGAVAIVPSGEGSEGDLLFGVPSGMAAAEVNAAIERAVAESNDENGERSDEVIESAESAGLVFLGNPGTDRVVLCRPWVGLKQAWPLQVRLIVVREL